MKNWKKSQKNLISEEFSKCVLVDALLVDVLLVDVLLVACLLQNCRARLICRISTTQQKFYQQLPTSRFFVPKLLVDFLLVNYWYFRYQQRATSRPATSKQLLVDSAETSVSSDINTTRNVVFINMVNLWTIPPPILKHFYQGSFFPML